MVVQAARLPEEGVSRPSSTRGAPGAPRAGWSLPAGSGKGGARGNRMPQPGPVPAATSLRPSDMPADEPAPAARPSPADLAVTIAEAEAHREPYVRALAAANGARDARLLRGMLSLEGEKLQGSAPAGTAALRLAWGRAPPWRASPGSSWIESRGGRTDGGQRRRPAGRPGERLRPPRRPAGRARGARRRRAAPAARAPRPDVPDGPRRGGRRGRDRARARAAGRGDRRLGRLAQARARLIAWTARVSGGL